MCKIDNVLVFFMSDLHRNYDGSVTSYPYYISPEALLDDTPMGDSVQTNETAIRVLKSRLEAKGEKIDKVFAFATKLAKKENNAVEYLMEIFPDFASIMTLVDIDEDEPFKSNLVPLAEMKEKIEAYVKERKAKEPEGAVQLHLDITGGFRHASMLMSALIKLLDFNELETKDVIYTKYVNIKDGPKYFMVEDAHEVLDMYKLISGVDEFVHYGSVRILKDYFYNYCRKYGVVISKDLQKLLVAMEDFSNRLKICNRQDEMTTAVIKLQQTLEEYENTQPAEEIEQFFKKLLPEINKEYKPLFNGIIQHQGNPSINVFALIHWCAEKDMLQQALVYYTEWVPEFLVENRWLKADNLFIKDCNNLNNRKDGSLWYDYLLTTYNRWNKELVIRKPTSSAIVNVILSRTECKPGSRNVIRLDGADVKIHGIEQCLEANPDNLSIIEKLQGYMEQMDELERRCGLYLNKNSSQDRQCFIDEAMDIYYDDQNSGKSFGFSTVLDKLVAGKPYNVSGYLGYFFDNIMFKPETGICYKDSLGQLNISYRRFGENLLRALSFISYKGKTGKYYVTALSELLQLPDFVSAANRNNPNYVPKFYDNGKGIARRDMLEALLKLEVAPGRMAITIPNSSIMQEDLLDIVDFYGKCKNNYRNFTSHASFIYKTNCEQIRQDIINNTEKFC